MEQEFKDRINLNTDLNTISKEICNDYDLGEYISDTIITVGYEDFNYILETTKGKYCVKIFHKERTDEDCKNYIDRIVLASEMDINTPKLYKTNNESECIIEMNGIKYRLCVFEYIDGNSFFDLGIIPNENEIKEIVRQMAIIHKQQLNSEFIYDKWAIVNFIEEFEDKKQYLNERDYKKLSELLMQFKNIDVKRLPHAFTHGDIISTNVMKDNNGKLWIIDFAVSNYLPRIVDLAVSSCNLCLNPDSVKETRSKTKMILKEYEKYNKLTDYEKEVFPIFFDIANIFNINSDVFDEIPMTKDEKDLFEKKMIRSYVNTMTGNNNITSRGEKIVNTYKNASYEPVSKQCALSIKLTDDSMAPIYLKGDRIFFRKKDSYNNGDDIVIAIKGNTLSVRRLYKSNKAIILQAMNPKYQTIVVNVFSEDMILGKVETMSRDVR